MSKFKKWHQNLLFWFMEKLNLGVYQVAWISWIKGFIMGALLLLLCSCGVQLKYGTATVYSDGIYSNDVILEVPNDVVDTLNFFQFKRKLRTDFNFRWDFAQYQINQPYNYYFSNYRFNYWRPYNSFDVWWNRDLYWTNWAFNYPFSYGWNNWNYPYYYYGWNNWYRPYRPLYSWYNGPFNNSGYNVVWNSSRRNNNIAYINGPRSSRNIENTITSNRRVRTYPNNNNNINNIINNIRENINIKPRVYNNPNNNNINNTRPNYNITRPSINNNNNSIRTYNNNSFPSNNSRSTINNSSRSSNSTSVRSNSRGKN